MKIIDHLPSGWLVDPSGDRMILFIKDPMSQRTLPKFYIDKWSSENGKRTKFKNRKISTFEDAKRVWNNLIEDGWNKPVSLDDKVA